TYAGVFMVRCQVSSLLICGGRASAPGWNLEPMIGVREGVVKAGSGRGWHLAWPLESESVNRSTGSSRSLPPWRARHGGGRSPCCPVPTDDDRDRQRTPTNR